MRQTQESEKKRILDEIFGAGGSKNAGWDTTAALDEIFGARSTPSENELPDSAVRYEGFETENTPPQTGMPRSGVRVATVGERSFPEEKTGVKEAEHTWRGTGDAMPVEPRFTGRGDRIYREREFMTPEQRRAAREYAARGGNIADWTRNLPEYHDLLNTGMSPEQADRYMTMQLMFPDRDIIGNAGRGESGMVLPSGQILRAEKDRKDANHDIDTFFEAVVAPKIDSVQRSVEKLKERYAPKDMSWRELIKAAVRNTPPPGAASTSALLVQAGEGRRERGPAKIVEEVLASVDPERTASYIADHLAEDPEFAAAAERVDKLLPAGEQQITEADIETFRKRMTPEQRREYDRAVEAEQQRLSAEQQKLQQAASNAWKRQAEKLQQGIVDRLVDEMARRNMPKNELEAFARTAYGASIPGMLAEWAIGSIADDGGMHARIMQQAMEKYDPSLATRIGGEAAGLLLSGPVFSAGGMLGKAGAAGIRKLAERNIVKRLANRGITQGAEGVARRLVATKPALQLAQGAVASGTTLGTFDAASTAAGMAAVGETPQAGDILGAAGRGFATGVLLPGIGRVAGRAADAASTRLGKYAAELGGFGAENAAFVGAGTLYEGLRTGEWGTPEQLAEGFGHSVGVLGIMKSIGALKRARAKNPGFYDKVLAETEFTPEETEALTRAGIDGRSYKRAVYDLLNAGNGKTGREVAQQAAEHLGSKYADVMRSQEVPISAKAKLMYLVEGRVPARTPLVTDAVRHQDAEGRIVVDLLDPAGNLVQRRRFDAERKAEVFENGSEGLRKANRIHYYENTIEEMQAGKALRDAAAEYAAERGMPVETVMDEVFRYRAGQPHDDATVKRVVERGRELLREGGDIAEMISDGLSIKYNLGEGDLLAMRNKREAVRTARERAIVDEYAAELRNFVRQEGFAPETGRTEAQGTSEVTERPEVRQAMEVAEREVAAAKNLDDNVVYEATMRDGATVNIVKGANLVYDPQTGEIDAGASDATVVVRYPDGSKKLVSIRDVDSIDEAVSSQDALDMARMAAETASGAVASGEVADRTFEEGEFVRLADGTVGVLDGRNEDGSFRFATLDADGRVVTRDVRGEEVEKAEMPESPEASGEENMELEPQRSSEETIVTEPEIPRQKDGSPDYNTMPSEMLAVELSATIGHDKAVERLRVARNANSSSIKKLQKALANMADLNKAISAEQRLAAMQAEDARIAGALAQLGAEEVVATDEQGRGIETFTQEIDRLFPDGLPNVRAQVLADIARGQRFIRNDSPDGTKRGVASELGFTGNESERRTRFGMLGGEATGAKHVSRYVHDLWQDSNGYAFDMDDAALRDEVIDVLLATPSRTAAMEQLRDMAARMDEDPAAPRDAEDWAAKQSYEEARKSLLGKENNGIFVEGEAKSYETGFNENNDESTVASGNVGGEMVDDPVGEVPGVGDRGDIRVFEKGLDASYNEHSGNSERDRREAESERLVTVAEESPDDVPFSVVVDAVSAPSGITPERWDVIIGQLKRAIGADNVVTDPEQVRAAYERIMQRGAEIRRQQIAEINERFNSQLEQLTPQNADSTILDLGMPSREMLAAGIAHKPLRLYGNKLLRKAEKHGYTLSDIRNLPEALDRPIAIFKGSSNGSFAVLTEIKVNDHNILVALKIGKGIDIDFNVVSSVYGKTGNNILRWINNNRLLFADKEKTLNYLHYPAPIAETLKNPESVDSSDRSATEGSFGPSGSDQELVTATNIVTNFENPKIGPENMRSEGSDTRYFRTPEGEVYGFTTGGKIYLDGTRMNAETPMHEYTELWSQIVARENPELWARGVELMKQTLVWDEVNADPNYKALSEELRASETLSRIVADEFAGKQAAITDSAALLGKLRSWLRKFWGFLKDTFSKWSKRELNDLTAKKFAQMPLRDFVEGIDLRKAPGTAQEPYRASGHKQMQLEIIERYNPRIDDVHTGIRSIEDIKSFDEVVQDARQNGVTYPDMDLDMLDEAARTGRITVYSSYPIKQGVFVTPSKMNAQDYAGGGRVYSKVVSIEDVAWIAQDEGQYAKVRKKESNPATRLSMNTEKARIRELAQADGTYLKAPNGKSSHLTTDQWETVRTRHFKKWFGDWEHDPVNASKVVDENGEPLVVYHGTDSHFHTFMKSRRGIWFTPSFDRAKKYATARTNDRNRDVVVAAFLNVKNPDSKEYDADFTPFNKRGYDGWISRFDAPGEDGSIFTVVVANPNQIKSATGNSGAFDPANPDIRFSREFTERRLTTLEKLENKRAALIADRENIANFDERLAAVDAEIEAYGQVDHVAATYGENGAEAESDVHLRAVEDAVYDIQRVLNVDNRIRVARNTNEFVSLCETFGLSRSEVVDETEKVAIGLNIGDEIFIRSDAMSKNRDVLETLLHERTHFLTDTLIPDTELYEAGIQIGAEYINRTLRKRSASYTVNPDDPRSVAAGVGEMISRDIDILTRDGLLTDYLADEAASTERMAEYMEMHNVPQALSALVLEQSENIKADLYGKQRTRDSQSIRESSEGAGHSDGSIRQADKEQGGRNRRMGDILDVGIGTDADVSGSGDERGGGSEKSGDSLRIIDDPSFSFEEPESARKLTKQQQLIDDLRRAVRETKASARTVAQLVSRRVREQLGRDFVQVMGKREFDAVIRQIEAATVRREVEKPLQRIAEIALDLEIKGRQRLIDKFLALKVEGRGPRGVSVAKGVDDRTRRMIEIVRNNLDRPAEEVAAELREQEDADSLYDMDAVAILEAYQEAQRYRREAADIELESAGIREQNTALRRERIQANASGDKQEFERLKARIAANNETLDALDAERLAGKEHLAGALKEAAQMLSGSIGTGREELRRWRKEQEERRKTILREAFADVDDGSKIPVLDQRPGIWKKGYRRTMDFLLAPAYSMNYLLKMISVNAPKGEGAMYDRFMRSMDGYVEARGRYYLGYEEFKKILDDKAQEVFGKSYLEVMADSNTPVQATITITDGKVEEQFVPTIGEALYIYMASKMTDGAVKLRRMGIVPETVEMLADILPPKYIRFADWLQEEFLPERRKNYNATHLAIFGTPMAQIEHYVPLKVQKSSVHRDVDGAEPDPDTLPSAITGSIIKRVRNRLVLDLHTNALDLMLEHGQQMEHWSAFSRVVLDMNTLLSSTAFRRMLDARNPGLHKRLKTAAQIAADSYRPQTNDANRTWVALGKLAALSKIAFRINTALKQVLSYPSFYAYSADRKFWTLLTKNLAPTTWAKNFRWCLDYIPSFRERWKGRMAGNEKLAQMTAPALDKWLDRMNKYGMVPNAFVDAQTCANGAKAVYDFRRKNYLERGSSESEADRLAKIDAAVAINETQQSSEGMYLGQIQVDRDFWSVSLSTFQNSNFSYLRKQLEGIDELFRNAERERRNRADYYKKQGFSDAEAFDRALKDVLEAKRGAVMNLLVFTFVLNMLWNLGSNVWKYKFAPESRGEIPEELAKSAFISTIRNTTIGSVAESFANGYDANPSVLLSDLIAFSRRLKRIVEAENPKTWDQTAAYLTLQTLTANGLGVDLESFVNMYQGIAGAIRDGYDVEDLILLLNAPKSQAKLIAGKPKEAESLDDYQRRLGYIERRITANIDKKQLDKWTRNYTAYRQAELLGLSPERDKTGYVRVPELREVDDSYASVLQEAGIKRNGTKRPDSDVIREMPAELRRELRGKVKEIAALQKQLEDTVVFNEAYAGKLRQLVRLKREVIEMWQK